MAIPFANSIDLLKNQLLNAVFQNLATAPTSPKEGQFYYNTTDKKMFYYNGTAWVDTTYLLPIASATVLGGVKVGSGLAIAADGTLSATGTDTEIINNLTSDRADAALAAAQGKILKGLIDALQTAINGLGTAATKDIGTAAGNIPVLDSDGKLNTSILPAIALVDTFVVDSEAAMLALNAQQGDVAVRIDVNKTFILSKEPASTLANWIELLFPCSVISVNGKTGAVVLTGDDIDVTVNGSTFNMSTWLKNIFKNIDFVNESMPKVLTGGLEITSNSTVTIEIPGRDNYIISVDYLETFISDSNNYQKIVVDWYKTINGSNKLININIGNTSYDYLYYRVGYHFYKEL